MPRCARCGNTLSFGSSYVPSTAPTANGPVSGLVANFDNEGYITEMDSLTSDLNAVQEAWERPEEYFDICYNCGSEDIYWE